MKNTNNTAAATVTPLTIHADLAVVIAKHGVPAILEAIRDMADVLRDHVGDIDHSNPFHTTDGNSAGIALNKMSQALALATADCKRAEGHTLKVDGAPDFLMSNDVLADMEADVDPTDV